MRQEEAAMNNGIALICVEPYMDARGSAPLLEGEIEGALVVYHTLLAGDTFELGMDQENLRTLVLVDGTVSVGEAESLTRLDARAVYVSDPEKSLKLSAEEKSHVLEVRRRLGARRKQWLKDNHTAFPMVQMYDDCPQYREDFKSRISISRSMIDHHALPEYCMGSNESYGPDRVEKHMHPLLDQFFFSFPDNDIDLMIDDKIQPYGPNTLIHIPLGSDHGVLIPEGKKMHYVWIDFMVSEGAVEYLDEVHKKTGVMEHFDESGQIRE